MSIYVDIKKSLANFTLQVSLEADHDWVGVLGSSGCGKSMTLKCIAGIEKPDEGVIIINGKTVFDSSKRICLPPQARNAGYLFQTYALFPTMTVRQNLEIVLKNTKGIEKQNRVEQMLVRLSIGALAGRLPAQLSGGQQQRVALARILMMNPQIVMLDEPFSALDNFLRNQIEHELREILADYHGTVLFVSHNRDEVYRNCRRMEILDEGRVVASGSTDELFRNPGSLAAAKLTGCKNIAVAVKIGDRKIHVPSWGIELDTAVSVPDDLQHVGIRAHHIVPGEVGKNSNTFPFLVKPFASTPFSHTEYLTLDFAQTTAMLQPLQREISVNHAISSQMDSQTQYKCYCLPPEDLLFLR